jgi:hypothetical protein
MELNAVSLKFKSLSELAECMFQLGVNKPTINYEEYILHAELTDEQLEHAISCRAQIVDPKALK